MGRLSKYLISNFFSSFLGLFLVLFTVSSMVFLLKSANVTALLKVSMSEFMYLYFLSLPQILFFTLPLTFFITAAFSLSKLFDSSELIVILSSGITPMKILKPFLVMSLLITLLLLTITTVSIPFSTILYKNFLLMKKNESAFNLSTSSVGQKINGWSLFIEKKEKSTYKKNILFNEKQDIFIISDSAKIEKNRNYFTFALSKGTLYQGGIETNIVNYEKLHINSEIKQTRFTLETLSDYIASNAKQFYTFLAISFFPFALFFFLAPISFFHNRYDKNRTVAYSMVLIITYVGAAFTLNSLYLFFLVPLLFTLAGYYLHTLKLKRF